ncbi:hypothetical protein ACKKBG_A04865 [Auxenochlorella protothecoides x Auxenochlorella symbiontica]
MTSFRGPRALLSCFLLLAGAVWVKPPGCHGALDWLPGHALTWHAPPSWWPRWPWSPHPPDYDTPRRTLLHPMWPDGSLASPVELELSQRQLDAEPRLVPARSSGARRPPRRGGPGPGAPSSGPDVAFNMSALTPFVPRDKAWMLDADQAARRGEGLDWVVARRLAEYVAASYCNTSNIAAWNCTRCGDPSSEDDQSSGPEFELETLAWDAAWDLLGFVGWSNSLQATVIAFRGTDSRSIYNWVTNMRTWRTDLNLTTPGAPANALVHGGFLTSWSGSSLSRSVTRAAAALQRRHGPHPVHATGHSLGGALATICAMELRALHGLHDVRLTTFGSPRVGNAVFAAWLQRVVPEHWRFTHNRDIVPSVAPPYMGFWHLAREVWVLDQAGAATLVGICDATGEDIRCHNSVCHLGLCSSVADHLLYLAEMYTPRPMGC